jgi:hypothetical protein
LWQNTQRSGTGRKRVLMVTHSPCTCWVTAEAGAQTMQLSRSGHVIRQDQQGNRSREETAQASCCCSSGSGGMLMQALQHQRCTKHCTHSDAQPLVHVMAVEQCSTQIQVHTAAAAAATHLRDPPSQVFWVLHGCAHGKHLNVSGAVDDDFLPYAATPWVT